MTCLRMSVSAALQFLAEGVLLIKTIYFPVPDSRLALTVFVSDLQE